MWKATQMASFRLWHSDSNFKSWAGVEGTNITLDFRFAADDVDHIRTAAIELLALGPDVMVSNSNLVTTILQREIRKYRSCSYPFLIQSVVDSSPT